MSNGIVWSSFAADVYEMLKGPYGDAKIRTEVFRWHGTCLEARGDIKDERYDAGRRSRHGGKLWTCRGKFLNAREKECNICDPKFAKAGHSLSGCRLCHYAIPVMEFLELKDIARSFLNLCIRGISSCDFRLFRRSLHKKGWV